MPEGPSIVIAKEDLRPFIARKILSASGSAKIEMDRLKNKYNVPVEGREPFLDHRLVEFALALPPRLKRRDGVGKWALRKAMRGILPDEIIKRDRVGVSGGARGESEGQ